MLLRETLDCIELCPLDAIIEKVEIEPRGFGFACTCGTLTLVSSSQKRVDAEEMMEQVNQVKRQDANRLRARMASINALWLSTMHKVEAKEQAKALRASHAQHDRLQSLKHEMMKTEENLQHRIIQLESEVKAEGKRTSLSSTGAQRSDRSSSLLTRQQEKDRSPKEQTREKAPDMALNVAALAMNATHSNGTGRAQAVRDLESQPLGKPRGRSWYKDHKAESSHASVTAEVAAHTVSPKDVAACNNFVAALKLGVELGFDSSLRGGHKLARICKQAATHAAAQKRLARKVAKAAQIRERHALPLSHNIERDGYLGVAALPKADAGGMGAVRSDAAYLQEEEHKLHAEQQALQHTNAAVEGFAEGISGKVPGAEGKGRSDEAWRALKANQYWAKRDRERSSQQHGSPPPAHQAEEYWHSLHLPAAFVPDEARQSAAASGAVGGQMKGTMSILKAHGDPSLASTNLNGNRNRPAFTRRLRWPQLISSVRTPPPTASGARALTSVSQARAKAGTAAERWRAAVVGSGRGESLFPDNDSLALHDHVVPLKVKIAAGSSALRSGAAAAFLRLQQQAAALGFTLHPQHKTAGKIHDGIHEVMLRALRRRAGQFGFRVQPWARDGKRGQLKRRD